MKLLGTKLSWILLTIALIGDFVVSYVLAFFYPNYSHTKQVMSVLGNPNSPVAFMYNIWLVILGILISFSGINFYITYSKISKKHALIGLIILLAFGVGAGIISGIFSVNETKEIETIASKIHGIGAGLGFLAINFMPLIVGMISFKEKNNLMGIVSIIFFILSLVTFVLFVMSEKEIFSNTVIGLSGLWQRLLLASMYAPLLLMALNNIINTRTNINS